MPRRGNIVWMVMTVIVVFFTLLSIFNIAVGIDRIAPSIWLAFVAANVWVGYRHRGSLRWLAAGWLAAFCRRHFAEVVPRPDGAAELRFGYLFLRWRLLVFQVQLARITAVKWSTGQASGLAHQDVNDWDVSLWYEHKDPVKSRKRRKWAEPDQEVYCVGLSGPRKDVESVGLALVELLNRAGVSLAQGDKATVFARTAPEPATSG